MFDLLTEDTGSRACTCSTSFEGSRLVVDASHCPGAGDLVDKPACRQTVIGAIGSRQIDSIRVDRDGLVHTYDRTDSRVLGAAAQFAERIERRDARLAEMARRDPVSAAKEAAGRAGLIGEIAAETGLDEFAEADSGYELHLARSVTPTIAASRIDPLPPPTGTLRRSRVLPSGATVRIYDLPEGQPVYHLEPIEFTLDAAAASTLAAAAEILASTDPSDKIERPGPYGAVEDVAGPDSPIDTLARVLRKHTSGYGIFEDLFSDEALSEVFVNAPAERNPLHVRTRDAEFRTNVRLTERGTARLAADLRAATGRPFSRASPTIDAAIEGVGTASSVRVAGVRAPASDGAAFALRAEGTDRWRLPKLVGNGTLPAEAAGLLSVSMARGAAILVAGPRGAGKTTLTAAMLWELSPSTRLVAIEDTPELPIQALQAAGRDAQRLEAASGQDAEMDPATALRTALRLGDGAIAVGEVRGGEAGVLYEAMRVGAASDTVIGTIHGEGYEGVKERVVSDLGVPESSFAATDLLVTLAPVADGKRVTTIEEVTDEGAATLFTMAEGELGATPRLERGNSHLLASLAGPSETYADAREIMRNRARGLEPASMGMVDTGQDAGHSIHG